MLVQDKNLTVIEEAIPLEIVTPAVAEEKSQSVGHNNICLLLSGETLLPDFH